VKRKAATICVACAAALLSLGVAAIMASYAVWSLRQEQPGWLDIATYVGIWSYVMLTPFVAGPPVLLGGPRWTKVAAIAMLLVWALVLLAALIFPWW
jgi:hypothetical protein